MKGRCLKCPKGFYKEAIGDEACKACQSLQMGDKLFIPLTTNRSGASLESMCICPAGFFGNWRQCQPCPIGSKCTKGASRNEACPRGTFQKLGSLQSVLNVHKA